MSDIRSAGTLAVDNLVYFIQHYPRVRHGSTCACHELLTSDHLTGCSGHVLQPTAAPTCHELQKGWDNHCCCGGRLCSPHVQALSCSTVQGFPWAAAGINVTRMLCTLMHIINKVPLQPPCCCFSDHAICCSTAPRSTTPTSSACTGGCCCQLRLPVVQFTVSSTSTAVAAVVLTVVPVLVHIFSWMLLQQRHQAIVNSAVSTHHSNQLHKRGMLTNVPPLRRTHAAMAAARPKFSGSRSCIARWLLLLPLQEHQPQQHPKQQTQLQLRPQAQAQQQQH